MEEDQWRLFALSFVGEEEVEDPSSAVVFQCGVGVKRDLTIETQPIFKFKSVLDKDDSDDEVEWKGKLGIIYIVEPVHLSRRHF